VFEKLPRLRSRFWSFVRVEAPAVDVKR
jgi:hypothetical protein